MISGILKNKILFVGPARKTRGGITAVIHAYEKSFIWKKWNCIWIETYIDKSAFARIVYFLKGLTHYLIQIWDTDIVHIHVSTGTAVLRKYIFYSIARLIRKKIVIHFHAFSSESTLFGKYKNIYLEMFTHSDRVIVLSPYWKHELVRAYPTNSLQTEVVFNPSVGVSVNGNTYSEKKKYILFAGTVNKRKGYVDLITAFSVVVKNHPQWRLIFAGNGDIDRGVALADELHIRQHVTFRGWISGREKEKLFRESSIFCLPSYHEGFPMAILDAMSFGLPIITTPVGGIMDVFTNRENALIIDPGHIEALSTAITLLIEDEVLRNKLMLSSKALACTTFSLDSIAHKLDVLYTDILKR
jgi:glycosyltransferase involved in cell wall biosynthesis